MSTQKEISLNQAVFALLVAARDLGYDVDAIATKAKGGILSNQYRIAEHPHVTEAAEVIDSNLLQAKSWTL